MKKLSDIKNVLVLGSGTLGLRVALVCALNNYKVKLYDIDEKALEKAKIVQAKIIDYLIYKKRFSAEEAQKGLKNIVYTTDPELAALDADLVSESILENLDLKKKVWHQFASLCPSKTIFTTNTSSLLPSLFAEETGRPEFFCALHFHDVFHSNVVDVMPNPKTKEWIMPLLKEFGKSIQQIPIMMKKESPGYIFNAMLISTISTAGNLVANGIATIEDVDRSWMGNYKTPVGPFGMLDEIGLKTVWHVLEGLNDKRYHKFSALLLDYINRGKIGVKTNEGFYSYPNPEYKSKGFV